MTTRPAKKSATGTSTKKTLLDVLIGWLPRKKEQDKLKKFVTGLSTDDMSKIGGLLKKYGSTPPPRNGGMQEYLDWHFAEKEKRIGIVQKIDGLKPREQADMKHAIMMEGRRLTEAELAAAFKNERTMLQYFSTLTASQLEAYRRMTDDPSIDLPAKVKKGLKKMFTAFRDERMNFEENWAKQVGPHIENIAATQTIMTQLGQLEKIQKQLTR